MARQVGEQTAHRVQPLAQVATAQGLAAPKPVIGVPRNAQVAAPGVTDAFFAAYAPKGKVIPCEP